MKKLYNIYFIFAKFLGVAFNKKEFENNNKLELEINEIFNSVKKKGNINEEKEKEKMDKIKDINEIKMIIETKNNFNCSIQEEIFEKNSLTNNHIEFIQSSSNLRARNYNIEESNINKTLMISGNIIASVPTSTSAIVGYACLQIINLMYSRDIENVIKNAFFNLGLNELDLIPQESIIEEKEEESSNKKKYPNIEIIGSKNL